VGETRVDLQRRRRIPSAIATLERRDVPTTGGPDDLEGIAISTFGKVIKSGWDWLARGPSLSADSPMEAPIPVGTFSTVPGRKRLARYGLLLQFESRPDDSELGRLVDSTIWINEAHPAYVRATPSRSTGYHIAPSVALALAPLAVGAKDEHAFITSSSRTGAAPSRRSRGGDGARPKGEDLG
jgi:hypothetical protein